MASFSTRSKVPYILKEDGSRFFGDGYEFVPGRDEVILEGVDGYIVTFGEMVYRAYDAALRLRQEGIKVGLVNKPTLNIVDEGTISKVGSTRFVLVVESLNQKTGVSSDPLSPTSPPADTQLFLARVQVWYLVARTWVNSQVCVFGNAQGGLRWFARADSLPGLGPAM